MLQPLELKQFLNELEDRHGRARNVAKFSDRTLDIDILLYDDLYLVSPLIEIPRAEIMAFAHVLKPLADLAPRLLHPVCRKTIAEIWQAHSARGTPFKRISLCFIFARGHRGLWNFRSTHICKLMGNWSTDFTDHTD